MKPENGTVQLQGGQRFWVIAKAYWFGEEKWKARGLLLLIIAIMNAVRA
ncbi:MAG: hypothetical protein AAFW75_16435 [Cyanobacteria bacterium J06636_16]